MTKKLWICLLLCICQFGCTPKAELPPHEVTLPAVQDVEPDIESYPALLDNISQWDDQVLQEIFVYYTLCALENHSISSEKIPFDLAFSYVYASGIYDIFSNQLEIRPELLDYFHEDTDSFEIPAPILDQYLLSKFNTTINHDLLACYIPETNAYHISPFQGGIPYTFSVTDVSITETTANFVGHRFFENIEETYQFQLAITDGEYAFLSVQKMPDKNIEPESP